MKAKKKIWKSIGSTMLAVSILLAACSLSPVYAEEGINDGLTEEEQQQLEGERQYHEIYKFYFVNDELKVTLMDAQDLDFENYPYMFPSFLSKSQQYLMDEEGRLLMAAICLVNGKYMSTNEIGWVVYNTWVKTADAEWMYFGWDGCALTSQWVYLNNTWYYLNEKGIMVGDWNLINGKWYYMDETSGAMQTGWIKLGKTDWYYLDPVNGDMKTGWLYENGSWYYLQDSGLMATGWLLDGSTWYYLESSGAMKTGWQKGAGDTWYYLKADGAMACNEKLTIDGVSYSFNQSGEWIH